MAVLPATTLSYTFKATDNKDYTLTYKDASGIQQGKTHQEWIAAAGKMRAIFDKAMTDQAATLGVGAPAPEISKASFKTDSAEVEFKNGPNPNSTIAITSADPNPAIQAIFNGTAYQTADRAAPTIPLVNRDINISMQQIFDGNFGAAFLATPNWESAPVVAGPAASAPGAAAAPGAAVPPTPAAIDQALLSSLNINNFNKRGIGSLSEALADQACQQLPNEDYDNLVEETNSEIAGYVSEKDYLESSNCQVVVMGLDNNGNSRVEAKYLNGKADIDPMNCLFLLKYLDDDDNIAYDSYDRAKLSEASTPIKDLEVPIVAGELNGKIKDVPWRVERSQQENRFRTHKEMASYGAFADFRNLHRHKETGIIDVGGGGRCGPQSVAHAEMLKNYQYCSKEDFNMVMRIKGQELRNEVSDYVISNIDARINPLSQNEDYIKLLRQGWKDTLALPARKAEIEKLFSPLAVKVLEKFVADENDLDTETVKFAARISAQYTRVADSYVDISFFYILGESGHHVAIVEDGVTPGSLQLKACFPTGQKLNNLRDVAYIHHGANHYQSLDRIQLKDKLHVLLSEHNDSIDLSNFRTAVARLDSYNHLPAENRVKAAIRELLNGVVETEANLSALPEKDINAKLKEYRANKILDKLESEKKNIFGKTDLEELKKNHPEFYKILKQLANKDHGGDIWKYLKKTDIAVVKAHMKIEIVRLTR